MSSNVHVLSRRKVDAEATNCADMIYNAQAIVRVCMAVVDPDNGIVLPDYTTGAMNRHAVWRALAGADQLLQKAGDTTGELAAAEAP